MAENFKGSLFRLESGLALPAGQEAAQAVIFDLLDLLTVNANSKNGLMCVLVTVAGDERLQVFKPVHPTFCA